jgi:hypothetical protein
MTQMWRDFLCLLHIWPVSHHMKLCPDLIWGLSHVVRSALMASSHWIINWLLLGVPRDRRMQGPLNAKGPDSGTYQYGLSPLHLDWMPRRTENFPSVSMWWRVHVSLDSVLTVVFIVVPESLFSFISAPSLCYTLSLSSSLSVHYVHIVRFIYFFLSSMELYCMFCEALAFNYLMLLPEPVDATGLCFLSLSLSPDPQLSTLYRVLSNTEYSMPSHHCPIWKKMLHHLSGSMPQRY